MMNMEYTEKKEKLYRLFQELTREDVAVAFSGGVDSSLILKLACMYAKENHTRVCAYTAYTQLHPAVDMELAEKVAGEIGAEHTVLTIQELKEAGIENNPENRCYLCKKRIFQTFLEHAAREGISLLIEGSNLDDTRVYRPGLKAISELGVKSPLMEAEFTKEDVRTLAAELQISSASRPSTPCMATRFPYGTRLTEDKLKEVENAEGFLRTIGFENIRLRVHENVARIEIDEKYFEKLLEHRKEVSEYLKGLGYDYITLDLDGFRSGSMDKMIEQRGN